MRSLTVYTVALTLATAPVMAQTTGAAPARAPGNNNTPARTRTASAARQALARAQAAYVARDYEAALAAFREASRPADATPTERCEAALGVGYTLFQRGDRDGALGAFREALQISIANNDPLNRSRALQAIASLHEAAGRWNEAATAWQDYIGFAEANPSVASAANGRARLQAIRQREEVERQAATVRARIEERQRQNARGPQAR